MIHFEMLDPRMTQWDLGLIPEFLDENDSRPTIKQLDENYAHGGGWRPMSDWSFDPVSLKIKYPGDPSLKPIARAQFRDDTILIYDAAFVNVVHKDGTFEISRMD